MNLSLSLSDDEKFLRLEALTLDMRAPDVELLISHLAERRELMNPQVAQYQATTPDGHQPIDATFPHYELAVVEQTPRIAVLSIAFPGLGWRSAALTLEQCASLGKKLLAVSS